MRRNTDTPVKSKLRTEPAPGGRQKYLICLCDEANSWRNSSVFGWLHKNLNFHFVVAKSPTCDSETAIISCSCLINVNNLKWPQTVEMPSIHDSKRHFSKLIRHTCTIDQLTYCFHSDAKPSLSIQQFLQLTLASCQPFQKDYYYAYATHE